MRARRWMVAAGIAGYASACAALGNAAPQPSAAGTAPGRVSFSRDIRPILSDNCFHCHGPDEGNRQGGLRLDRREDLFTRRGPGAPIVAGRPNQSRLWVRIAAADPARRMPPISSHRELRPDQKELVRRWIEQGASWESHWAFEAPRIPALPAVKNAGWVRTPIDRFVLARLEREGLAPSPEADRVTLLRRLSLDLIGLPPTPVEVDAFVADRNPNAYEKQVERLLASPHYGERWGRLWLDVARYADSDGFEKDKPRFVWFYRDWVVNAFNRDLPYNQFIIEQIAGDLLPNPTQDQIVATGFLRNSMINEEGGVDPEQFRMEAMFDRMDAIGKGVLGLTIQCAQCHTHKYDPLTHDEYYRMFAFLNNSHEANVAVYTPDQQQKRADLFRQVREAEQRLQHANPDWAGRMAAWEAQVAADRTPWEVVRPALDTSGGQKHILQEDGSILAQGYSPAKQTTDFSVKTDGRPVTGVRLELLNDTNLPHGGPGRSVFGLFGLTEFRVTAAPVDQPEKKQTVKIATATADVNPPEAPLAANFDDRGKRPRVTGPIQFVTDGKDDTAWGIDVGPGRSNVPRKAVFTFEKPIAFPRGTVLTFFLDQKHGGWNNNDNQSNNLGRFRFSITGSPNPAADPVPQGVRQILALPAPQRSPAQVAALFSYWRTTVPEWKDANTAIERLWQEHPIPATQLVLQERRQPRQTMLLARGDQFKPARPVTAGVPGFLHSLPAGAEPNRLTFARWLVDPKSPTTSRSIVNRVWQTYFGTGIVSTSEDLGFQSEKPSHPELLDYLASMFSSTSTASIAEGVKGPRSEVGSGTLMTVAASGVRGSTAPTHPHTHTPVRGLGWSLKKLHRLIVTSATYRQSSAVTPGQFARDPYNRLLARGARYRVEAELVRDVALAASGLLNPKLGGRGVYPPAPEFLFLPPASYGPKVWRVETGPERYRRALYTFRYRSVPFPALQNFDAPNGDASCVRRVRSNTPLQALTTLNEPLFMECAQTLGLKTLREGGASDAERLAFAFRQCVSRRPSGQEAGVMLDLLAAQRKRFEKNEAGAWELSAPDPKKPPALPAGSGPADLAAWTAVARVLLNLDETITRE